MAISLGRFRQHGEKVAESKRLAEEYERQQKKAKDRGFFSSVLGGVGGKILGKGLVGALGLAGPFAPIAMALAGMATKKIAHEATRGMAADPSKIASKSKYGYGVGEAKTLREGLEEQQRASDPMSQPGAFGKALLGEYVEAGAAGRLGAKGRKIGFMGGIKEAISMPSIFGGEDPDTLKQQPLLEETPPPPTEYEDTLVSPEQIEEIDQRIQDRPGGLMGVDESQEPFTYPAEFTSAWNGESGGLVPEYKNGGTISDYFGMQGVTLGGSNKQSLSEILGRK